MIRTLRHLIVLLAILTVPSLTAQPVSVDLQALLDDAVAASAAELVIPPGTYRVAPPKPGSPHLVIKGASNLHIIAEGVTLICTSLDLAMHISGSRDVTLTGLTIDYDPLPFTQGQIIAMAEDGTWFDVSIDAGYRMVEGGATASIYSAADRLLKADTWTRYGATATPKGEGVVRVSGKRGIKDAAAVGDLAVIRGKSNSPHAIMLQDCQRITLDRVTLHASPTFGFLENSCDGNTYQACRITPGPPPTPGAPPRLLSTNADGIHSKHAKIGPTIEGCLLENMADDGIAINGDYALVGAAPEPGIVYLVAKYDLPFKAGDRLLGRSKQRDTLAQGVIAAVEETEPPTHIDPKAVIDKHLPGLYQKENLFRKWYRVTLDSPMEAVVGDIVSSPDRSGSGFVVRGNTVRNHRARGLLIKASDGLIEGNTIENSSIAGIVLCPEPEGWMEADFCRDVRIVGNTVRGCGFGPANANSPQIGGINVTAALADRSTGHANITITGNTLEGNRNPQLLVMSAHHVTLTDNTLLNPVTPPEGGNQSGSKYGIDTSFPVWLNHVGHVTIDGNTLRGRGASPRRAIGLGDDVHHLRADPATAFVARAAGDD